MTTDNDKDRIRFYGIVSVVALVVMTWIIFAATVVKNGNTQGAVVPGIIALSIAALGASFLKGEWGNVRDGIPLDDERSQRVKDKAGAWTFYSGIYLMLAMSWYDDYMLDSTGTAAFRDASQALGIAIICLAALFGFWYWYHNRTGEVA
ncbi:MAG: hypothetical protein QF415_02285 [Candidatus Undinarchaeales archaeon]|jgi:uncharacterized membrane protein|nr:hypothetical protein [Candidatus Undinarchaeales archaeon]MDP7492232.1 hypothetical protein [Candidatus Undinarchaeales archaeon]